MSEEARAHYERGLELYGAKDYAGAIHELDTGYTLDPRREFLFAEAQAHRLNGDCKSAVPLYKRFLDSDPDDVQVNAAHIALARCAEQMAIAPATPPARTATSAPITAPTPGLPPAPPRPWYRDTMGGVLLGAGIAALAVGSGFSFAAQAASDDASGLNLAAQAASDDANRTSPTYLAYQSRWSTARSRNQIAFGAFAAGAALTAGAIYRYFHVRRAHAPAPATPRLDAWAAPVTATATGGAIAGIGGRF